MDLFLKGFKAYKFVPHASPYIFNTSVLADLIKLTCPQLLTKAICMLWHYAEVHQKNGRVTVHDSAFGVDLKCKTYSLVSVDNVWDNRLH